MLIFGLLLFGGAVSGLGQDTNASASSPPSLPATASTHPSDPFAPTMQSFSNYQCPDWFRDAKFGIWSHWGPDSIPGISNNYAHDMWSQGSADYNWHMSHYGHPSKVGYIGIIEGWKAEKFDPDALVAEYKAAGAKYVVALATHHDNFDCWDSTYHEWNSVKHGPHKDIVGLWREATLKAGLRFGISSHADDRGWNYMYAARLSDTSGPLAGAPYEGANPAFETLYNDPKSAKDKAPDWWNQLWEKRHLQLLDKYRPDFIFFDGGIPHGQYGKNVVAKFLNTNAKDHNGVEEGVVTNGDLLPYFERGVSPTLRDKPWMDASSVSGWFYINHNPHADSHSLPKSATTIIHTLIDVVSKNGNLLMNFPQRGDGSLYPECEVVLAELAKWMPINGEGIFNTRPWTTFGEGPNLIAAGYMNEPMQPLTWQDIRYTTKGKVLYAFCLGIPQGEIKMSSLASVGDKAANVELLGSSEKISWKAAPDGLVIEPSAKWPCDHAVCYKVTLN
jgi:alpha-L-fucosidase